MKLEGKVAIVTGSGSGIGETIAKTFAREGARLCITGRTEERLHRVVAEIKESGGDAIAVPADVSRDEDIERMVQATRAAFGPIDILVNNAGITGPIASILETTRAQFDETLAINLTGVFLASQAVIPDMIAKKRGWIVNVGSTAGKRPLALRIPYATTKIGLIGLTRSLAVELGPHNINVNVICPGVVKGDRTDFLIASREGLQGRFLGDVPLPDIARMTGGGHPALGRMVDPEDCAELTLFLCTEESRNLTGLDINVAAGLVMH